MISDSLTLQDPVWSSNLPKTANCILPIVQWDTALVFSFQQKYKVNVPPENTMGSSNDMHRKRWISGLPVGIYIYIYLRSPFDSNGESLRVKQPDRTHRATESRDRKIILHAHFDGRVWHKVGRASIGPMSSIWYCCVGNLGITHWCHWMETLGNGCNMVGMSIEIKNMGVTLASTDVSLQWKPSHVDP